MAALLQWIRHSRWAVAFTLGIVGPSTYATEFDQWIFGSKYDFVKVINKDGKLTYNGQPIDFGPFEKFVYLFKEDLVGTCQDLPPKADTTIKAKKGDQVVVRHFFFDKKIVSDGKNCITVQGDGIYYTPMHRAWFTGKKELGVPLGSEFKVLRNNQMAYHFKKEEGEWKAQNENFFPNYVFVEEFEKNMKKFRTKYRVHEGITSVARDSFAIETEKKTYSFYLLADNLWALKYPNGHWLVTCEDWSFMQDMRDALWRSRHSERLGVILDKTKSLEDRKTTLIKLGRNWDKTIRMALFSLLLDPEDDNYIKSVALKLIKLKPSNRTMKSLVKALKVNEDGELREEITKVLQIRNPKGPMIAAEDSDIFQVDKKIEVWQKWADGLKDD